MAQIKYIDTDGDKSRILPKGYFGMDDYPAGNDVGRVYISTGVENMPLAKKAEIGQLNTALDTKANKTEVFTKEEVNEKLEAVSANALAYAVALG